MFRFVFCSCSFSFVVNFVCVSHCSFPRFFSICFHRSVCSFSFSCFSFFSFAFPQTPTPQQRKRKGGTEDKTERKTRTQTRNPHIKPPTSITPHNKKLKKGGTKSTTKATLTPTIRTTTHEYGVQKVRPIVRDTSERCGVAR